MTNRRLIDKRIIYREELERLPDRARLLYIYFILEADDDGFVGNPARVVRMAGASEVHYRMLIDSYFLHEFKTGIAVILHWFCHNVKLREGYVPTVYNVEYSFLEIQGNGEYEVL